MEGLRHQTGPPGTKYNRNESGRERGDAEVCEVVPLFGEETESLVVVKQLK